jgi:hypothetical protein
MDHCHVVRGPVLFREATPVEQSPADDLLGSLTIWC